MAASVLTLVSNPCAYARLRRAAKAHFADTGCIVQAAACWRELERLASEVPPRLVIFDPYASGRMELGSIDAFRDRVPQAALVAYGDFASRSHRDILRLARSGVREIILLDEEDSPAAFRQLLANAIAEPFHEVVLEHLARLFPPHLVPWFYDLLRAARHPLSPVDAAKLYHRHPNTLRTHLRAAGLPPVNHLIVWARLFHAAHLLTDRFQTVESVARDLRFASPSALQNQMRRYAGLAPGDVRRCGGVERLLDEFRIRHAHGSWELGPSHAQRGKVARESEKL